MGGKESKPAAAAPQGDAKLIAPYPVESDVQDVATVVATYESMYTRCGKFMKAQESCAADDKECNARAFLHLTVCLAGCVAPCATHAARVRAAMDRFRTTERTTNEEFESVMAPALAQAVQGQQACLDRFDELAQPVLERVQRERQAQAQQQAQAQEKKEASQ